MSLTALSGSFTQQCIFGTARAAKKKNHLRGKTWANFETSFSSNSALLRSLKFYLTFEVRNEL